MAPDVFPLGETTVTWTAVDTSGNSAVTTQTVTIVDTTKPALSIPQDQIVEASNLDETFVNIGQAEAHDITGISSIVNNAPDVFPLGSTLVTWTTTDNHENTTTAYQTITVVDTTAPTIIVPDDITSEAIDPNTNHIELGELVASDSVGVESITNELIFNVAPLPVLLVTVIVQSEYVPLPKEFRVIVLLPAEAVLLSLLQLPPYVMVPAYVVEKV